MPALRCHSHARPTPEAMSHASGVGGWMTGALRSSRTSGQTLQWGQFKNSSEVSQVSHDLAQIGILLKLSPPLAHHKTYISESSTKTYSSFRPTPAQNNAPLSETNSTLAPCLPYFHNRNLTDTSFQTMSPFQMKAVTDASGCQILQLMWDISLSFTARTHRNWSPNGHLWGLLSLNLLKELCQMGKISKIQTPWQGSQNLPCLPTNQIWIFQKRKLSDITNYPGPWMSA